MSPRARIRSMIATALAFLSRHAQLVRFFISGSVATATNLVVAFVATDILGLYYLLSSGIAFALSFLVSFSLQKFWTFESRDLARIPRQATIALGVAGGNLVLNTFLVFCFVECAGLHYLVGQFLASAIIACETFFLFKFVVFTPARVPQKETPSSL